MPPMSNRVNNALSWKEGSSASNANSLGPDERSLFCLFTEFQENFSSPSSHGPPAGLYNRVASGHSGHAPHSYSGEGETVPTWKISATHVPTSGAGGPGPGAGPFFLSGFHHSVCFLSLVLQSWWVWSNSEITDLWYNCFHDNITDTWLCAASSDNGRSQTRGCLGGWLKPSKKAGNLTWGCGDSVIIYLGIPCPDNWSS